MFPEKSKKRQAPQIDSSFLLPPRPIKTRAGSILLFPPPSYYVVKTISRFVSMVKGKRSKLPPALSLAIPTPIYHAWLNSFFEKEHFSLFTDRWEETALQFILEALIEGATYYFNFSISKKFSSFFRFQ